MLSALLLAVTASTQHPTMDQVRALRMHHLSSVAAQIAARRDGALAQPVVASKVFYAVAAAAPRKRHIPRLAENADSGTDTLIEPSPIHETGSHIAVRVFAAPSQSDTMQRVCGSEATICTVWWPNAVGDAAQYRTCAQQPDNPQENFGQTRAEYCSMTFGGDCDGVSPQGPNADLCTLVHGVGVRWGAGDQFGDFVMWGECSHFALIKDLHSNFAGLGLDLNAAPPPDSSTSTPELPTPEICAGTLYLLESS